MFIYPSSKNILLSIAVLSISLKSCTTKETSITNEKFEITDSLINQLIIDTVQSPNSLTELNFSAKIVASENLRTTVYPMVSGLVRNVNVSIGDKVTKGQTLATVTSAEMAGFDKEVVSAAAELRNAQRSLTQAEELHKSGLISTKELEESKNDYIVKKAEVQRASAILKLNGGNAKGVYRITAPLSGYVIAKNISNYMQLRPDYDESVFEIADLSQVWSVINVYESELGMLKEGYEAEVKVLAYPDQVYKGKIERIYQTIDSESKVMNARVALKNTGFRLKPGMIATVKVMAKSNINLPSVPTRGVIFDDNKNYVLVLDSAKKIRIQEIEIARKAANLIYVSKGLGPGDRIVASKQVFLFESLKN